jgi:hypothetical protein
MWQYILDMTMKQLVEKAVYPIVHLRLVMDIKQQTILTKLILYITNNTSTYSASPLDTKTELLLEVEQRKLKAKVLIFIPTLLVEQIT